MGNSHVDVSACEISVEMGRTQSGLFDKMLLFVIAKFFADAFVCLSDIVYRWCNTGDTGIFGILQFSRTQFWGYIRYFDEYSFKLVLITWPIYYRGQIFLSCSYSIHVFWFKTPSALNSQVPFVPFVPFI